MTGSSTNDARRGMTGLALLIITVGVGWLLSALGVGEGINWVWTLGLGMVGIGTFALSGVDKASVVFGPLFLAASVLSILRQAGKLRLDTEIPLLVILIGVLLLVAQSRRIRSPSWYADDAPRSRDD